MEFSYAELGHLLALSRAQKRMRQIDVEDRSEGRLKQPAISAAERGETRIAVDTLIEFCNALQIRTETLLDPFLTTSLEHEESEVIMDPFVLKLAKILRECTYEDKILLLQIAVLIRDKAQNTNRNR